MTIKETDDFVKSCSPWDSSHHQSIILGSICQDTRKLDSIIPSVGLTTSTAATSSFLSFSTLEVSIETFVSPVAYWPKIDIPRADILLIFLLSSFGSLFFIFKN